MRLFTGVLIMLFSTFGYAQKGVTYYAKGETLLLKHQYKKALKAFKKVSKEMPEMAAAYRAQGICHELLKDFKSASSAYEKAISLDSFLSRPMYFETGLAYYKQGNIDQALHYFLLFENLLTRDKGLFDTQEGLEKKNEERYAEQLSNYLAACYQGKALENFESMRNAINLGPSINSPGDEYFPYLIQDHTLYYTSRKKIKGDENLFVADLENGSFKKGDPVNGSFNTSENEGMATWVRNNKKLFFTACNRVDSLKGCDLWEGTFLEGRPSELKPLKGFLNSDNWESQATISCDGRTIFFASNQPGGFGGTDIWKSQLDGTGNWSQPINLGPNINTKGDEEAPFITNDGNTLYFSSTGHVGYGEQDIFFSKKINGNRWGPAVNLGNKVNTPYRELGFFLTYDGQTGYFASDKPAGNGGMDIYKFSLDSALYSPPTTLVQGVLVNAITELPMQGTLDITGYGTIHTEADGTFFLCIPADSEIIVDFSAPGFKTYTASFEIPYWDNRNFFPVEIRIIPLDQIRKNDQPVLEDTPKEKIKIIQSFNHTILFGFDDALVEALEKKRLIDFLNSFPEDITIEQVDVFGYADDFGTTDYNLQLSEMRAKNVARILLDYQIKTNNVFIKGRGELRGAGPRSAFRKVEVKITGHSFP
jgi:outer membrane protein OmpA-like peptidoglycan-associated protein/Tol biopolymer transport system component